MSEYDKQRSKNVANALAIMASFDMKKDLDILAKRSKKKSKPDPSKKRGARHVDAPTKSGDDEEAEERPKKLAKVMNGDGEVAGVRRSARNRGKELNYKDDGDTPAAAARALPRVVSDAAKRAGMESAPRDPMKRKYDP